VTAALGFRHATRRGDPAGGVDATATGKTVWVLLDLRTSPAPRDDGRDGEVNDDAALSALLAVFGDEDDRANDGRVRDDWPAAV